MNSPQEIARRFDTIVAKLESVPGDTRVESLMEELGEPGALPYLFELLNMKGRRELGVSIQVPPSAPPGSAERSEEVRKSFQDACREVARRFTEGRDLAAAWPYLRAAELRDEMKESIEAYQPGDLTEEREFQQLEQVIQIAMEDGIHPVKGYALLLEHHGTCDGVTTLERDRRMTTEEREECGELLIRRLRGELIDGLRQVIADREKATPEADSVAELIEDRGWIFRDGHGFVVDDSHLQSCIRLAGTLTNPWCLETALEFVLYARTLESPPQEIPPFDKFYDDYEIFLNALLGRETDRAVAHFEAKAREAGEGNEGVHFASQIYVFLLERLGRTEDAIAAYRELLAECTKPLKVAPSLVRMCERVGDADTIEQVARARKDLVLYGAAQVLRATPKGAAPA